MLTGEELMRFGAHFIALICGAVAFFCFWASFYVGGAAVYAIVLWLSALALEYAVREG